MSETTGGLFRGLLHKAFARYLRVSPQGLHLDDVPTRSAVVRIIGWGPARTLYRHRKPACRSLDAVVSVTHVDRRCDDCPFSKECTGQVRLDVIAGNRPYRLLLAFTSAKNFLVYETGLQARRVQIEDIEHQLDVIDRKTFGELRFSMAGSDPRGRREDNSDRGLDTAPPSAPPAA